LCRNLSSGPPPQRHNAPRRPPFAILSIGGNSSRQNLMFNYTPPPSSVEEKFIRSGGHGGQNVNKVATTVQLRFFPKLSGLPDAVRLRLETLAGGKLTADGEIIITASEYRTQEQNRQAARARLSMLVEQALRPPKKRRPTARSHGSHRRRLESKKQRGEIKRQRGAAHWD